MKKAGALAEIRMVGVADPEVKKVKTSSVQASVSDEPKVETENKSQSVDDVDWSIAPVGSQMLVAANKEQVSAPDVSHLNITPMQGYLVKPAPEKVVEVPDISHLKLED